MGLVLTDGAVSLSNKVTFEEEIVTLKKSNITMYAVGVGHQSNKPEFLEELKKIAGETGVISKMALVSTTEIQQMRPRLEFKMGVRWTDRQMNRHTDSTTQMSLKINATYCFVFKI